MLILGSPFLFGQPAFIDVLTSLGLTSGLRICLDAGDGSSYDGTSQTWVDRSGNAYSVYRGSGSGSDGADPTFNGTSGGTSSSDYFSYDGGDYFTLNQANPSWIDGLHQNNATFTVLEWVYASAISAKSQSTGVTGTFAGPGVVGWEFGSSLAVGSGLNMEFIVSRGASNALETDSSITFNNNAWNMIGFALDEPSSTLRFVANANYDAQTKSYSSPSSASAGATFQVGACGGGSGASKSGGRIAMYALWTRTLSEAEMTSIYQATKTRFGL